MSKPLAIELYSGLSGWGAGFLAEGYDVWAFDIKDMFRETGQRKPDGIQLVLYDVLQIHGSMFRNADVIVSSSPCQEFSYRSLPFKRCKNLPEPELGIKLFKAQYRIQREASEAAGHHIPMVVENVRGAQKYVGRAAWHFGSYYLFGDVPAIMPYTLKAQEHNPDGSNNGQGSWFKVADAKNRGSGLKLPGNSVNGSRDWKDRAIPRLNDAAIVEGSKGQGGWFEENEHPMRKGNSKSSARKAATALISKIPFALSSYIASVYYPR